MKHGYAPVFVYKWNSEAEYQLDLQSSCSSKQQKGRSLLLPSGCPLYESRAVRLCFCESEADARLPHNVSSSVLKYLSTA